MAGVNITRTLPPGFRPVTQYLASRYFANFVRDRGFASFVYAAPAGELVRFVLIASESDEPKRCGLCLSLEFPLADKFNSILLKLPSKSRLGTASGA